MNKNKHVTLNIKKSFDVDQYLKHILDKKNEKNNKRLSYI